MMNNKSWRGGYVRIGSVRVRVSQDEGGRVGDECCCGVSWSSRIPVAKNNSASSLGVPSRSSHTSLIPALDRLPKFHFGGSDRLRAPAPTNRQQSTSTHKKKNRSSDKTDRLRELTEKLKSSSSSTASSLNEKTSIDTPPVSNQQTQTSRAKEDELFDVKLNLAKPESRAIVGAYIQRTIPFRSASFSQVDFSPSEGKYNIRNARNVALANKANKAGGSLSLPRKKLSEGCGSVSPSSSSTLPISSNLSLDSAVGSEEWTVPKNLLVEKPTDSRLNNRSLTHPLGRRGSHPDENIPYSSIDGNGLKSLTSGVERVLEGVKEESDTDSAAAISDTLSQSPSLLQQCPDPELILQCDQPVWDKQSAHPELCDTVHLEDSIPDASGSVTNNPSNVSSVQNKEQTTDSLKDIIEEEPNAETTEVDNNNSRACQVLKASKQTLSPLNIPALSETRSNSKESDDSLENKQSLTEVENNNVSDDRSWSTERRAVDWASSAQEEPQSPEELNVKPIWPRNSEPNRWPERPRLICQSSEEREEDCSVRNSPRRFPLVARTDSLSEGESDNGCRTNTPSRGSPSLFQPSDQSDCEGKFNISRSPHPPRRYSKRPLRGPYGQMLEAEMKKPETRKFTINHEDLKFLEEYNNQPSAQSRIPVGSRPRAMDDSQLKRSYTTSQEPPESVAGSKSSFKRKISANISSGSYHPHTNSSGKTSSDPTPIVHHQRTTSSPSQLEGCSIQKEKRPEPSHQLLAQLLKGSSERNLTESNPLHVLMNSPSYWKDTRTHVVVELYETERSYVESLQILVMKYLQPLKSSEYSGLVDVATVDEIFYKIPEILAHHEVFLEELRKRLENWDINQKVGDLFLDTFTKQSVIDTYTEFINNWENAKEAIKTTSHSKPAFARFLDAMAREHKGKLALDSLLIMPVQRIPRYELLIQTLIKHTDDAHGDASKLTAAQQAVHELAVTINLGQHKTLNPRSSNCQELTQIESIIDGLAGLSSPERTFLGHDQVSITTSQGRKERALFLFSDLLVITTIKRRSGTIRKIPQSTPGSIVGTLEGNKFKLLMKIPLNDLEIVKAKDDNIRKMLKEMEQLNADVSTLSQMAELVTTLHCPHSQLEENIREMLSALNKQLVDRHAADSQLSFLELMINTSGGQENIALTFSKPEKRTSWEEQFNEAKQRLASTCGRRMIPELVSAVPIRKTRAGLQFTCAAPTFGPGPRDVWVCNSDGYVGQVCILSLHPEPTVTSCNGVCNARILCIAPVPGQSSNEVPACVNCNSGISISVEDTDESGANIHLDSSSSSEEEEREDECDSHVVPEGNVAGTMWLGTEDGCIHVYNCNDNIRTKKNKVKIQHNAPVHTIIYLENRVFVALANGDVTVYLREPSGNWNTNDAMTVTVGSSVMPVTKMVPISGRLWCSCHTSIKILNTTSFLVEHSFVVSGESNRSITSIAVSGLSVWISLHNSSTIRLFHGTTYEWLGEVNVAPAVTKMLASSDDIIRQHKAACLRVTSLLACKDLLWIGTSAGVILTMPLPQISATTAKLSSNLSVTGVPHGHTGHVRFLTTVDISVTQSVERRRHSTYHNKQDTGKLLVISGGDGYEDFRSAGLSEVAGREDSTNHLLLWNV
ncbi:rho guanine nucleotide exchange factor 17 isoform X2 [Rhodnius prolixus]|uniref:rho guanine nucleotide exchange factor 17 isoform X2 n=1 Tax=Rhodnius prolixus TaxID=13249 RepID=UPI003D18CB9C